MKQHLRLKFPIPLIITSALVLGFVTCGNPISSKFNFKEPESNHKTSLCGGEVKILVTQ